MKICIVGRGKVGRTFQLALKASTGVHGYARRGRADRIRIEPNTELVILAVPDSAIAETAERIVLTDKTDVVRVIPVVHVAGALGPSVLSDLRARGHSVGAMHPMVSFTSKARADHLRGTAFVCAGDAKAMVAARALARHLGAHYVAAEVHGPAYHAAGALIANGAAALADAGAQILERGGLSSAKTRKVIAGLLHSVARNVEHVGVPGALSGPILRGDGKTLGGHIAALRRLSARSAEAYLRAAPLILATAKRAGLSAAGSRRISAALSAGSKPRVRRRG